VGRAGARRGCGAGRDVSACQRAGDPGGPWRPRWTPRFSGARHDDTGESGPSIRPSRSVSERSTIFTRRPGPGRVNRVAPDGVRIGLQARPWTPWGARGPVRVGFWLTGQTPAPAASPRNVRPPDLATRQTRRRRPRAAARGSSSREGRVPAPERAPRWARRDRGGTGESTSAR